MTEVRVADFVNALTSKGFQEQQTPHHKMLWFVAAGKRTPIHTWISHGERKLEKDLLQLIARELRLTRKELAALVKCEIGEQDYLRLMIERGQLTRTQG